MLIIIVQWIYLICLTYVLGSAFAQLVAKMSGYRMKSFAALEMTGLCMLTVYAQFFSIFKRVGEAANIIIAAVFILLAVCMRKDLINAVKESWRQSGMAVKIMGLFFFMLWAYFSSRGYMMIDTPLYHAQSIRWIEEYGVVKGLGNLHNRFAYNSSLFSLHALLSMRFVTGGISLHTANGFIAYLLTLAILTPIEGLKRDGLRVSDFAKVAAGYYLTMIIDEVLGPSSDYATMCVVFFLVILWIQLLEKKEESYVPYALLCVLGVFALTLKLSAGLILLLVLKPAVMLIKKRQYKQILFFLALGILAALPWLIRSVIISGWLLYPFSGLDLFAVDWKMPKAYVDFDAAEIRVWGRALYQVDAVTLPVTRWFGNWFQSSLHRTEKILILGDLLSLVILLFFIMAVIIRKEKKDGDMIFALSVVACSYLYWQLSAPLIRYGYAYVLLLLMLTLGYLFTFKQWKKKIMNRFLEAGILLFVLYKALWVGNYLTQTCKEAYYLIPQDYERYELEENDLGGLTVYTAVRNGETGYYTFPAVVDIHARLRGNKFEDGFADDR